MKLNLKSILNATWKVGLGLFGLGAAIIGILLTCVWHHERHGVDEYEAWSLSKDVAVQTYNDTRVRIRNNATGRFTTPKLEWVCEGEPRKDSLTVFCDLRGRRGFLNVKNGEIVIPAQYAKAWLFSEGLGAILGKNGKVGFIDKDNRLVIDCIIPYEEGSDYVFKDGCLTAGYWQDGRRHCAVFGKDGQLVLGWNHTRVDDADERGYRVAADDNGCWLYDRQFKRVFPAPYDDIELARGNEGVYVTKGHVKQLVDFDGTVLEPFVVDDVYQLKYVTRYNADEPDTYEILPDVVGYRVSSWEGLMDARTGKALTPAIYWSFDVISKDLIQANLGYSEESVVLDRRGRLVKQ